MMRPRMSRIFYEGKYYDYPLKASNVLQEPRHLGGVPLRDVVRVGAHPPAEGPDHARGLDRRRASVGASTALLQDLQREAVGRPGQQAAGRLRRPTHQEPLVLQRGHQRAAAQAQPEGHHLADRGVPVPEVRPRHDVGALPRPRRGQGLQGDHEHAASSASTTRTTAPCRSPPSRRRCPHRVPVRPRHLVDADLAAAPGDGTARRRHRRARRRRPALPRLPHRRARRARGVQLPGQLDLRALARR